MFLPKKSKFKIDDREYSIRIEPIWFFEDNILPRYQPTYTISNSKGEEVQLDVKNDATYKELISFVFGTISKRLINKVNSLLNKKKTITVSPSEIVEKINLEIDQLLEEKLQHLQ